MDALERLTLAGRRGVRIAVAESLTSGLLCAAVGKGEAASDWFAGGLVAYFTEVKQRLLGLDPKVDPCSASCAIHLATATRVLFDVDVALATTGVGGPDSEGGHSPGTVFLGWATPLRAGHRQLEVSGSPEKVLAETVERGLALLAELALESARLDETT